MWESPLYAMVDKEAALDYGMAEVSQAGRDLEREQAESWR